MNLREELLKCIKAPFSENIPTVKLLKSPKTCRKGIKAFLFCFINTLSKTESRKAFLVRSETLDILLNMLTTNDVYFCHYREKLPLTIQMQLSKKPKKFRCNVIEFFKFSVNFENFGKKMSLTAYIFLELLTQKDVVT